MTAKTHVFPKEQTAAAYAAWREWVKVNCKNDVTFMLTKATDADLPSFFVELEHFMPNFTREVNGRRIAKRWHKSPFVTLGFGHHKLDYDYLSVFIVFTEKSEAMRFKLQLP